MDELRRAHAYAIPYVVLHPGAPHGQRGRGRHPPHCGRAQPIHAATPECAGTLTLLELMAGQGTVLGRNFAELRAILDQVEDPSRVALCADTCHAFAAGYDLRTQDGYDAMMDEMERELGLDALKVLASQRQQGRAGQQSRPPYAHRRRRDRR